jgi:hypothetical protein
MPIAGATIKLAGVRGPHDQSYLDPVAAPLLTISDAQGRFILSSLRPDSRYFFFVDAPTYGGVYLREVRLTANELKVTLGSDLLIRGKVIHAPRSISHEGKFYLSYGQWFDNGGSTPGMAGRTLVLEPIKGEANFTIGPFYKVDSASFGPKDSDPRFKQPIELYAADGPEADFGIDQLPISNFVFDLAGKSSSASETSPAVFPSPVPLAAKSPASNPQTLSKGTFDAVRVDDVKKVSTLLLDAGADPNQVDRFGNSPIVYAQSAAVAQVLIDHGAKLTGLPEPLLPRMISYGFAPTEALEAVLKAGADQDPATLKEALLRTDLFRGDDYPAKEKTREWLLALGAKLYPAYQDYQADRDAHTGVSGAGNKGIVSTGHVSMADGTPLGKAEIMARVYSGKTHGSEVDSEVVQNGTFPLRVSDNAVTATVAAEQPGCAVIFAGPFVAKDLDKLNDLQLKLTRGFAASVQTVDEAGHPISGARLESYYAGPPEIECAESTTDAAGTAVIEHLGEAPLNIRVLADGFQADEVTGLHLDPVRPYRWTLKSAQPLHGTVVASATGMPIAGADIKLAGVRGPHDESHTDPRTAPRLATADSQGFFTLRSLRPDSRYFLYVEAPGYGNAFLREIRLTQGELKVTLGPELRIRGKIIHAPLSVIHQGKLHLQYRQVFDIGDNLSGGAGTELDLQPVNGEADFAIGPFYRVDEENPDAQDIQPVDKRYVVLNVDGSAYANFSIGDLPLTDFVFDLAEKSALANGPTKPGAVPKPPTPSVVDGEDGSAPNPGNLDGEYKTSPGSAWTLDMRKDGTAYYYSAGERYTARYALTGDLVTFTFPDGSQEQLQVDGSQLLGVPGNKTFPVTERLKRQ